MGSRAQVTDYIARQSLISAVGRPWTDLGELGLESPFQTRSLNGDLRKDALSRVRRAGSSAEVVLLDLVDERLGVHLCPDGRAATHSYELTASKALTLVTQDADFVAFGSDLHYEKWRRSVWHLRQALEAASLWERTIVMAPAWATRDDLGQGYPPWRGLSVQAVNERFTRYYRYLEVVGLPVARVSPSLVVGKAAHRWSRQPYHYVDQVYAELAKQIEDFYSLTGGGPQCNDRKH